MDFTTNEIVKLIGNTYRIDNSAIASEFERLAYTFDIKVWEALEIGKQRPRVVMLRSALVGGHSISVELWFLVEMGRDVAPLIEQIC